MDLDCYLYQGLYRCSILPSVCVFVGHISAQNSLSAFLEPFSLFLNAPNLHAIQCGAGTAHTAGSEAALLWQRPVTQGEQLTAQTQILPAQPRLKATLGILAEQLAAPADVLCAELGERRCAVSIVPESKNNKKKQKIKKNITHD